MTYWLKILYIYHNFLFRPILSYIKTCSWYTLCVHWKTNKSKAKVGSFCFFCFYWWRTFGVALVILVICSHHLHIWQAKFASVLDIEILNIHAKYLNLFIAFCCRYQILGVFLLIQLCVIAAEGLRRSNLSSIASSVHPTSLGSHQTSTGFYFWTQIRYCL